MLQLRCLYSSVVGPINTSTHAETFVADVDEIGSFGDLFGGPTGLDREEGETNREEATRKLLNRLKFGSESLLVTPAVVGVGKGAKALATRGQELVYSNSKFERWVDKYIGAPFRPRGDLPQEVFEAEMQKQGLKSRDIQQAKDIVRNITKVVDSIFPDTKKILDKSGKTEKEIFTQILEVFKEKNLQVKIKKGTNYNNIK